MNEKLSENYRGVFREEPSAMLQLIEEVGQKILPKDDLQWKEAVELMGISENKMELIENSFILGCIKATRVSSEKQVPVYDIPMMSDERWNELARENAVHNYTKQHGCKPKSIEQAVCWQRAWVHELLEEHGDLPSQKARAVS